MLVWGWELHGWTERAVGRRRTRPPVVDHPRQGEVAEGVLRRTVDGHEPLAVRIHPRPRCSNPSPTERPVPGTDEPASAEHRRDAGYSGRPRVRLRIGSCAGTPRATTRCRRPMPACSIRSARSVSLTPRHKTTCTYGADRRCDDRRHGRQVYKTSPTGSVSASRTLRTSLSTTPRSTSWRTGV